MTDEVLSIALSLLGLFLSILGGIISYYYSLRERREKAESYNKRTNKLINRVKVINNEFDTINTNVKHILIKYDKKYLIVDSKEEEPSRHFSTLHRTLNKAKDLSDVIQKELSEQEELFEEKSSKISEMEKQRSELKTDIAKYENALKTTKSQLRTIISELNKANMDKLSEMNDENRKQSYRNSIIGFVLGLFSGLLSTATYNYIISI